MARKNIAVLDFGSNHITTMIGDKGVNGTFEVRGFAQSLYSGFMNGEVLEPELLSDSLCATITNAESNARAKITHLYVGVPAEFSIAEVRTKCLNFGKKKHITEREIEEIFSATDEFSSSPTHIVINRSPICYELDSGERLIDPRGHSSTTLCATINFMLCERSFVGMISQAIHELKIPNVEFISEPLSESILLLEPEKRDQSAVLVDCGYLTTSVSVVVGDGIVHLRSFSLGGGHIVADIGEMLNLPFDVAEKFKRAISLTGRPTETDKMSVEYNGDTYTVDALAVYEITMRKVRQISKMISKSLDDCEYERPDFIPIHLTGGGISYIKGVAEAMRGYLGKEICVVAPNDPQLGAPTQSAILGLLDLALTQNRTQFSLFFKIFKKHF